jgi:hypothetical protein
VSVEQLVEVGVEQQHAEDWLAVRAKKSLPLTRTAWDQVRGQAVEAGIAVAEAVAYCAANSWAGFKASWVSKDGTVKPNTPNRQQQLEDRNRELVARRAAERNQGDPT